MCARLPAVALLLAACASTDRAWLECPPGRDAHPGALPIAICAGDGVDPHEIIDACEWWGGALGARAFFAVCGAGAVDVSIDDLEPGVLGLTSVRCAEDGEIEWARITLSRDLGTATRRRVLRHEIGHLLALSDDPGPPQCVELSSVMGDPLDPWGDLTDADLERLAPYLEQLR